VLLGCIADTDVASESSDITVCTPFDARLPNRTVGKTPLLGGDALEVVANLSYPPGNVAVSRTGRTFVSFFPDSNKGDFKIAEIVDGEAVAYPSQSFQKSIKTVLGIKIDRQERLWLLDYGDHGIHQPKIVAIDLETDKVAFSHKFSLSVAPIGSMLNDLQISPDGKTIYISDTSHVKNDQALVVLKLAPQPTAKRRLQNHKSVDAGKNAVFVNNKKVKTAGVICLQHGVDGIALDQTGSWLYYSSLNRGELWRIRTTALRDFTLTNAELAAGAQKVADTTMSDGMTSDAAGHIYMTDLEHSAIVRVDRQGRLAVLVKDKRLRWPDGFSWGPEGDLYVTASALHQTLPKPIKSEEDIAEFAPYQLFRLMPQDACADTLDCSGLPGQ
jgi:sugar lactone lactonase YvrE